MNELCEKHLQTLKKQIGDVNATGYRQVPDTDSHLPEPKFQDKQEEGNVERADHTKEHMGLTT